MAEPKTEPQPELTGVTAVQEALWQMQLRCLLSERMACLDGAMGALRQLYFGEPISTDDQRKLAVLLTHAKRVCQRAFREADLICLAAGFQAAQQFLALCTVPHAYRDGYDPRGDWRWALTQFVVAVRRMRREVAEEPSTSSTPTTPEGPPPANGDQEDLDWLSTSPAFMRRSVSR